MSLDMEKITEQVLATAGDDRKISCTDARNIADEHGMPMGDMGQLCDELDLKIYACELGCF